MFDMYFQYGVVALILVLVVIWIIRRLFFTKNKNPGECSGCALAEKCTRQARPSRRRKDCESERSR